MGVFKLINILFSKIEAFVLSWGIIFVAIILIGNSLGRVLFSRTFSFAEEVGQLLMLIVTFFGASHAVRFGRHVSMSAVFDAVPYKMKKIFLYVISFGSSASLFFLAYLSVKYIYQVYALGRITPALSIPAWIIYSVMPLGFFLMAIQYLIAFVLNIKHKNVLYIGSEIKIDNTNKDVSISSSSIV